MALFLRRSLTSLSPLRRSLLCNTLTPPPPLTSAMPAHVHRLLNNTNNNLPTSPLDTGKKETHLHFKEPGGKFMVIGHRGNGMNALLSSNLRMKAIKENTILSFNTAAKYPLDFIEFDVQVTSDGYPIIFHDDFIYSEDNGMINEKRITELSLSEFLSYGPPRGRSMGRTLMRKMDDGRILNWSVEQDDFACTLQEALDKVSPALGFNIELKFDDNGVYQEEHLTQALQAVLQVMSEHAKERPIMFSTFQPDAALLIKKLQSTYPVYFLTDGGTEIYRDTRRNSLEEAMKLCIEGGLQGIVSEVRGVFRNPVAVKKIKDLDLSFLTYGKLNNVAEAVQMQYMMGIDGVIVDLVKEMTEAVSRMVVKDEEKKEQEVELAFLLKLIPELLHHH